VEVPVPWTDLLDGFEGLAAGNLHFEAYWFPHTGRALTLRNNRTHEGPRPLSPLRRYVEDELLANTAFGALNRIGDVAPVAIPAFNRLAARAQGGRTYCDSSHRVFTSARRVRFKEMEYAVPREAGMAALREIRSLIDRRGWRISFPLEIRHAPRDDCWLSPAYDRDSVHISLHVNARTDHTTYFGEVERLFEAYDGRPHWGKLHSRTATDLAKTYPRFEEFVAVRDRVDPDRLFTNAYLDRVLDR
jgi:FAD/FMN-containing dehydrogenase